MKKIFIILAILLTLLFGINNTFGNWYGNHSVSYSNPGGTSLTPTTSPSGPDYGTRCSAVAENNSPTSLTPHTDTELSVSATGNMRCLYWDATPPTCGGWTEELGYGQTRTMTLSNSVDGDSGISDDGGDCLVSVEGGTCTEEISDNVGNTTICTSIPATRVDRTPPTCGGWTEQLGYGQTRIMTLSNSVDGDSGISDDGGDCSVSVEGGNCTEEISDNVGNTTICTSIAATRVDRTPPTITWPDDYVMANDELLINITDSASGYDEATNTGGIPIIENTTVGFKVNVSDLSGVNSNGYKSFDIKANICDIVNNCINKEKTIYIYANEIDITESSVSLTTGLSSGSKVANGGDVPIIVTLEDEYGNEIIPVKESDGITVIRDVDLNVNFDNSLYLNQYSQSTSNLNSAVFIGSTQLDTGDNQNTPDSGIFINEANGIYILDFKVYAPTFSGYDKTKGSFTIDNITAQTSKPGLIDPVKTIQSTDVIFNFKPIYKTVFNNYGAKDNGFVEGISQTGSLALTIDGTPSASEGKIYLEFGKNTNSVNTEYNMTNNGNDIAEGYQINYTNLLELTTFGGNNIDTLLIQDLGFGNPSDAYITSIIKYMIDGKTIIYPSDIVGKDNYFSTTSLFQTSNKGVKILGNTYSENQTDIIVNQNIDVKTISGKITKATLRSDIRSNVYKLIKNLGVGVGNDKELLDDNLIYYKLDGTNIEYSDINSSYKNSGKTILIEGGDLIIDENIVITGIMGIIVMKNNNGNGGKILIGDDVTKITAVIYADKALIPYNLTADKELIQSDGIGYFSNQLFIEGSIFSYNTLGGSRYNVLTDKYICPYYVTDPCTMIEAQKYDFNFIRRYYRYQNGGVWTIANSGDSSPGITGENLDYPLIIKYNPLIQTTPPPLFSK